MTRNLLYVGTYTDLGMQSGKGEATGSQGIYLFRRDPESGILESLGVATEAINPSFLVLRPDERFLFAVNETAEYEGEASGAVSSFVVNDDGSLHFVNKVATGGGNPCHLSTSPDGRFLYVANWNNATVSTFPVDAEGRLSPFIDRQVDSPTSERPVHAHFVSPSPDGRFVFSTDTGTDRVNIFRPENGLVPIGFGQTHEGGSPRHLAFSPDGRHVFANGEGDLTLSVFRYQHGELEYVHHVSTLPKGGYGEGYSTSQIAVHPGGAFVYVANRGANSIAIFRFDGERAEPIGFVSTEGQTPRNFMLDPEGRYLYAANQDSNTIETFAIDATTGLLTHQGSSTNIPAPTCLVFTKR